MTWPSVRTAVHPPNRWRGSYAPKPTPEGVGVVSSGSAGNRAQFSSEFGKALARTVRALVGFISSACAGPLEILPLPNCDAKRHPRGLWGETGIHG